MRSEVSRRQFVHLSESARIRGSGTSTLSPRGNLKDSPAVCRSGCRPTDTASLNSSWLPLEAIVLTAPRGGASPQSRDLRAAQGLALTTRRAERRCISRLVSDSPPASFTSCESDGSGSR